jgi:hypothetical protein
MMIMESGESSDIVVIVRSGNLFEALRQELKLRNYSHKTFTAYRS